MGFVFSKERPPDVELIPPLFRPPQRTPVHAVARSDFPFRSTDSLARSLLSDASFPPHAGTALDAAISPAIGSHVRAAVSLPVTPVALAPSSSSSSSNNNNSNNKNGNNKNGNKKRGKKKGAEDEDKGIWEAISAMNEKPLSSSSLSSERGPDVHQGGWGSVGSVLGEVSAHRVFPISQSVAAKVCLSSHPMGPLFSAEVIGDLIKDCRQNNVRRADSRSSLVSSGESAKRKFNNNDSKSNNGNGKAIAKNGIESNNNESNGGSSAQALRVGFAKRLENGVASRFGEDESRDRGLATEPAPSSLNFTSTSPSSVLGMVSLPWRIFAEGHVPRIFASGRAPTVGASVGPLTLSAMISENGDVSPKAIFDGRVGDFSAVGSWSKVEGWDAVFGWSHRRAHHAVDPNQEEPPADINEFSVAFLDSGDLTRVTYVQEISMRRQVYNPLEPRNVQSIWNPFRIGAAYSHKASTNKSHVALGAEWQANKGLLMRARLSMNDLRAAMFFRTWGVPSTTIGLGVSLKADDHMIPRFGMSIKIDGTTERVSYASRPSQPKVTAETMRTPM